MRIVAFVLLAAGLFTSQLTFAQQPRVGLVQQFQQIEDSWSLALVNKDQFALDNLLAPEFIDISAAAQVQTRDQRIADALSGMPQPLLSIEQRVVNVREVGDIALVEGTYKLRWKEPGDHIRDESGIFTHVYDRLHNHWTALNAQQTAVLDAMEGAKPKRAGSEKKKSHSDLPFHIPLLSHDSGSTAATAPTTGNPQ